jgi:hypothetical protein
MCAAQSRRLLQYGGRDVGDATRKGMKSTVRPQNTRPAAEQAADRF